MALQLQSAFLWFIASLNNRNTFLENQSLEQPLNSHFIFATCQSGMENYLKQEFTTVVPEGRFSFSQRGFVVFKTDAAAFNDSLGKLVSARTFGHSLFDVRLDAAEGESEQVRWSAKTLQHALDAAVTANSDVLGETAVNAIVKACTDQPAESTGLTAGRTFDHLHVWLRDGLDPAGEFARSIAGTIRHSRVIEFETRLGERLKAAGLLSEHAIVNGNATLGSTVLDVCVLNPYHFWLGKHEVQLPQQKWSGGVLPLVPAHQPPISRAYYKIRESVIWAGLEIDGKTRVAEIGASPGGSCQWLLEQGAEVIGIDPADMDARVSSDPKFTHIRKRGREIRRKEIAGIHCLLSDANISPDQILDTFEELLKHPTIRPQVLIVTIKLPDVKALEHLASWKIRVASWGYSNIRCRQLIFNRQEVTLVATKH